MSETATAPDKVADYLTQHYTRFGPHYGKFRFSDHLPMAALAYSGLGENPAKVLAWAETYAEKLEFDEAFARQVAQQFENLKRYGREEVLQSLMPELLSGWYRGAYHPIIRLGYGVEFGVDEEIAAALTYWQEAGGDARLQTLAESATPTSGTLHSVLTSANLQSESPAGSTFGRKAEAVIQSGKLDSLNISLDNHTREFSEFALRAFHQTHDFFALHLVTGTHAFRICRQFAPENSDNLFSLGLLIGYLAIGAPEVAETLTLPERSATPLRDLVGVDEHNIKVAYSCQAQSNAWNNPQYEAVAEHYLRSQ